MTEWKWFETTVLYRGGQFCWWRKPEYPDCIHVYYTYRIGWKGYSTIETKKWPAWDIQKKCNYKCVFLFQHEYLSEGRAAGVLRRRPRGTAPKHSSQLRLRERSELSRGLLIEYQSLHMSTKATKKCIVSSSYYFQFNYTTIRCIPPFLCQTKQSLKKPIFDLWTDYRIIMFS